MHLPCQQPPGDTCLRDTLRSPCPHPLWASPAASIKWVEVLPLETRRKRTTRGQQSPLDLRCSAPGAGVAPLTPHSPSSLSFFVSLLSFALLLGHQLQNAVLSDLSHQKHPHLFTLDQVCWSEGRGPNQGDTHCIST